MATITISDETIAGEKSVALELEFARGRVNLRALIASRVEEVRRFHAQESELFRGLVQPSDSERNGFFVFVDERQVENLDDEIKDATIVRQIAR